MNNATKTYKSHSEIKTIHITNHAVNGKLAGFHSISTSVRLNPYCKKRCDKNGLICKKCYADVHLRRYKNLDRALTRNTELLTTEIIPWDDLPRIMDRVFRFESFGDLHNEVHFENYLNICLKNPDTTFAIWTKNPFLMKRVFNRRGKPDNLIIILSSPLLNRVMENPGYDFVDKVFTVWTKEGVKESSVELNCTPVDGSMHRCADCMKCYRKDDPTYYIHELLK